VPVVSAIIVRVPAEESLQLIARVPLFAELSRAELERIADVAIPRSFPKGVRVFHEGDHSDACYVVRQGDLRVTREHSDGRAIALATLGPGDIFGELAMLDGGTRSASVETLSDSELLGLPATDVRRVIADHGDIAAKLIVAITRRLRETNERVARQSFQTVPSRVAGVLAQLIAEEASEERPGITVRMTQADLAQLAGTSRESVSRFLATLERAGVVAVGRGRVTILEPRRLRAYIF
jgi:CRP/FNR family transcriptional regulator, cyclic AMP receptor protein